ncbi:C40 family peptidase [Ideonella sp. BN130291]|uniref:C40 family peptidase n=1 Tax=Ideonella sp. BN130291 TaxID=3112940 RepID=UPI003FA604F9
MPRFAPSSTLRRIGVAAALSASLVAFASPDAAPADPVSRFLTERGLLDTNALKNSALVQQVRDRASDLVMSAMNFLGVPYRRGGNSAEDGFDCSGFTRHVFDRSLGLLLPRRADEQARAPGLFTVKREELKPGDLVFFNTLKRTFSHVGIYVGEGKFIHAPRSGSEVRIEDMRDSYWAKRFTGARRAPGASDAAANLAAPPPMSTGAGADAVRPATTLLSPRPE